MSRTFFSLRRRRGFSPRPPAPVTIEDAGLVSGPGVGSALFHPSSCIFISSDDADRFLKLASTRGCTVSTMVLSATRGLVLFRVIREGIGLTQRLSATGTCRAYRRLGCSPSNPSVSRTNWPPPEKRSPEMEGSSPRRSSGLRFQFVSVEVFSLLPQSQRDGCNLARQRETRHRWLDAFGQ
jgi:hypothetical protein